MNGFQLPADSVPFFQGIDLFSATPVAQDFVAFIAAADRDAARRDPSKLKALLRLSSGAVLWSAKLAVDADGVNGQKLDPADGQNQTSWRFADGSSLDSVRHPYYVLPMGIFGDETGLHLGDVAAVVYRNQITGALFGDEGPHTKIGEASIAVHDGLRPAAPDCCHRDGEGNPTHIIDLSIDEDVLVVGFPGSAFGRGQLTPDNLAVQVRERAYALFAALKRPAPPAPAAPLAGGSGAEGAPEGGL